MDLYLENGLMLLAQQIAQDQKDLYLLEDIQLKSLASEENNVFRHDYTDTYDAEVARNQAEDFNKDIVCDMLGNCRDVSKEEHDLENELAQTTPTGSGAVSSLQNAAIAIMALFALTAI